MLVRTCSKSSKDEIYRNYGKFKLMLNVYTDSPYLLGNGCGRCIPVLKTVINRSLFVGLIVE